MPAFSVDVTQTIGTLTSNLSSSEAATFAVTNSIGSYSYFTLETVRNADGFYDSTSPKNLSGSFTLGSGISNLVQSDYIAAVAVAPGGGQFTYAPSGPVTGSSLYLRGVSSLNDVVVPSINWDVDALLYVNSLQVSASVTLNYTEQNAVNNMFRRMKGLDPTYSNFGDAGIYNATKALYPYVGSNLEAYRFNAVFPTAVTQATDIIGYPTSPGYQYIAGGVTVDGIYGPKGNGTNGVILTNLNWGSGQASALTWNDLSMGAVYKTTSTTGRDDFGEYNPNAGYAGIWLRTKPSPPNARMGCLETGTGITGPNLVLGGNGHWMLWRSGADKRVYYQQVQQTYSSGADRTGEVQTYHGADTWAFLSLNFSYFNGGGASSSPAVYASRCANFSSNTLMLSYIMTAFSSTLIPAWNQIVEDFCAETGKKTW